MRVFRVRADNKISDRDILRSRVHPRYALAIEKKPKEGSGLDLSRV